MKLLIVLLLALVIVILPLRSSWGEADARTSCLIQSDVHRIKIGAGCRAGLVVVPRHMHVVRR